MTTINRLVINAALVLGAALLLPFSAFAGSCCGGGSASTLVLPKYFSSLVDVSVDFEKYDGFWNENGRYIQDPPGSDLRQYRLNLGYGLRLSPKWQTSIVVPAVWNVNQYVNQTSRKTGIGDTTLNLWYELFDDASPWKIRNLKELSPSVTIGPSLLLPTGISPYDTVQSSFDVTGRGFYRLDGNVLISKTLQPFTATVSLSYGAYLGRAVNREYGRYVEPYHKKLGNRSTASASLSYIYYVGSGGDALTFSGSVALIQEADATISGQRAPDTGFDKDTVGVGVTYSSTDRDWSVRMVLNHALRRDGWGENFPATDIYTVGVSYGFR